MTAARQISACRGCVSLPGVPYAGNRTAGLRRQSQTVDEIAHRAMCARQHEQFQDRLVTVVCGQIRPEVVVDRAVLLLWELRGEPLTFPGTSGGVRHQSGLAEHPAQGASRGGIVDHDAGGYRLTQVGRALIAALQPLQAWAEKWATHQNAIDRA